MARKNMKEALTSSLQAEDAAVRSRFDKAESLLGGRSSESSPSPPLPLEAEPQQKEEPAPKVVRDSFTIPASDYDLIAFIRQRCLTSAISVNKGEVIRAGLHALQQMPDEQLLQIIEGLEKVKTGRPSGKRTV
jgi:hypothetical protein